MRDLELLRHPTTQRASNRYSFMPKLVFYYIQKEAGSCLQHPDCFAIDKSREEGVESRVGTRQSPWEMC